MIERMKLLRLGNAGEPRVVSLLTVAKIGIGKSLWVGSDDDGEGEDEGVRGGKVDVPNLGKREAHGQKPIASMIMKSMPNRLGLRLTTSMIVMLRWLLHNLNMCFETAFVID